MPAGSIIKPNWQRSVALDRGIMPRISSKTYFGQDIVELSRRLALMNLTLRNFRPEIKLGDSFYEVPSLRRFEVVMTNPQSGAKGANRASQCGRLVESVRPFDRGV